MFTNLSHKASLNPSSTGMIVQENGVLLILLMVQAPHVVIRILLVAQAT